MLGRLGKSSFLYTSTLFLQSGLSLILLPLYTHFLSPNDYGILSVVTTLSSLLSLLFTLSLNASIIRFYYDHKDDPQKMGTFWGSIFIFMFISSAIIGGGMLAFGGIILKPLLGNISFYPYGFIGILTCMFSPFFEVYLSIMQAGEESYKYCILSLARFGTNISLTLLLVVVLHMSVIGVLIANLAVAFLFFITAMFMVRHRIIWKMNFKFLKQALCYSAPLIPHNLSSQINSTADKILLNRMINTSTAGLYNIGFLIGSSISLLGMGINRAFVPISMETLKAGDKSKIKELADMGTILIVIYCMLASILSIFSSEIVRLFTTKAFYASHIVIPFIAFNFVLVGVYYLFVNILFFVKSATKYVAITTFVGMVANVVLNIFLIPLIGIIGSALAFLLGRLITVILVGFIALPYQKVDWPYKRIGILVFISFAVSVSLNYTYILSIWESLALKSVSVIGLFLLLNYIAWGRPLYLAKYGNICLKRFLLKRKKITCA